MLILDQGAVRPKVAPGVVDLGVACGPGGTKCAGLGADGTGTCQSCRSMW